MDPAVKAEWLKRLRSGAYKQGKKCLRNDKDEYCCLGVLVSCLVDKWELHEDSHLYFPVVNVTNGFVTDGFYVPDDLAMQIDIDMMVQGDLADKNDRKDWSFSQIADYIEKEL